MLTSLQTQCPSGVGCLSGPDKLCTGTNYCNDTSDNDPQLCNDSFNCTATGRVRRECCLPPT